ncbi:MAG: transposase [Microthrixaceae bacterium]|nr:transposase [Microthrixaceae bacterium]
MASTSNVVTGGEASGPVELVSRDVLVSAAAERLVEDAKPTGIALTGEGDLVAGLVQRVLQAALESEITCHLGYESHAVEGRGSGNSRDGYYPKTVCTEIGDVGLRVPRDRNASRLVSVACRGSIRW